MTVIFVTITIQKLFAIFHNGNWFTGRVVANVGYKGQEQYWKTKYELLVKADYLSWELFLSVREIL